MRLISGPGGAGKTRLAAEAVREMRAADWTAGFLPPEAASALRVLGDGTAGLFLVVDYPEERRQIVDDLIAALAEHGHAAAPIRVLLISRRGIEDWDGYATRLKHRFGRQELVRPGALTAETALQVLEDAARGLAELMGVEVPPLDAAAGWLSPVPDDPERRLPLFAAAAGLHAVMDPGAAFDLGGAQLMQDLARRELDRVNRTSLPLGLRRAEAASAQDGLARLLALGTSCGAGLDAATLLDLQEALRVVPGVEGEVVLERVQMTSWWSKGGSGTAGRLMPLTPDRLAAAFVAQVLLKSPHPKLPEQHWFAARAGGAGYGDTISRMGYDLHALGDGSAAAFE
ncbi:hypothetical protein, partial [Puniceibacterium sediminis]|uniref:hypothetical protein n=1 Tax=Puniceibacterium sediminis TaxID=1608407 RepID=UPI001C3D0FC0